MDDTTAIAIVALGVVGIVAICYLRRAETAREREPRRVTLEEIRGAEALAQ